MSRRDKFDFTIISIVIAILIGLMVKECNAQPATAAAQSISPEKVLQAQITIEHSQVNYYKELVHAYGLVLHRVWIDRPAYVEDALMETSEFAELQNLLEDEDYHEIFKFYDENDSIEYHDNWNTSDALTTPNCIYIPPIPQQTQQKLHEVFGNGD